MHKAEFFLIKIFLLANDLRKISLILTDDYVFEYDITFSKALPAKEGRRSS